MRRSNCAGAMEYVPELSWLLFLRILDERETAEAEEKAAVREPFTPSLAYPYRWQDWAAPGGRKRLELQQAQLGAFFRFLHEELLPHLRGLEERPGATPRQKVISEILSNIARTRIDTEYNLWEVVDKIHEIKDDAIDSTHIFPLSQVYEGLLLSMGEKRNDGGQFFTPREVIRAIVRAVNPHVGQAVYDPCCGTGGFLAQAYEYMSRDGLLGTEINELKHHTFYGREKDNTVYPIALANLILHGIDQPNLWHGNTLTGREEYGGLFGHTPALYDVILTNPPFGGKEGKEAQTRFAYKTSSTQLLFLQHVIESLAPGGVCGMVVDEGVLFRTNESAFVKTKKKLLEECNLWCILSLPGGVFTQAGAGVKTNLLFFTKGGPTEQIWYYDLSHLNIRKRSPLTLAHFDHFFALLPGRAESDYSWTVDVEARKAQAAGEVRPVKKQIETRQREAAPLLQQLKQFKKGSAEYGELERCLKELDKEVRELKAKAQAIEDAVYDLKAVNPNAVVDEDTRTPQELLDIIEAKGREVAAALALLRQV
ncbi:MAG: N-6 DNA methylase [Chloroflexi bacterium]|nr:N-6 DNA methylase [Chloroflexota bacterium]MCI0649033.1 N-6 DNA methylase [Chloroflexota bacterium]